LVDGNACESNAYSDNHWDKDTRFVMRAVICGTTAAVGRVTSSPFSSNEGLLAVVEIAYIK
jgi:hypothetical protein